jgi:hypothetical protein
MNRIKNSPVGSLFLFLLALVLAQKSRGQAQLEAWGNLSGIRIEGQLLEFESSIRLVGKDWSFIKSTAKERQQPQYTRESNKQIVSTRIDSISFNEQVEDLSVGEVKLSLGFLSRTDTLMTGIFLSLALPVQNFSDSSVQWIEGAHAPMGAQPPKASNEMLRGAAGGIRLISPEEQLELRFDESTDVFVIKEESKNSRLIRIYIPLGLGQIHKGQSVQKSVVIKVSGTIDRNPIHLSLNTTLTGREFDGLGGNFRLQNPKTDSEVISYCLEGLRVAWGRVEMPWRFWQPEKISDPMDSAKAGILNPQVRKAMEMARTLNNKGIPLILSAWSAPNWAIQGRPRMRPGPDGLWGNPLDPVNTGEIYKSLADYLVYLRKAYGVDIRLFSLNESDLGINIRLTAQEHADFIRGLGSYFVSRGLKTRMLLGDNSDATTYSFIYPAMEDSKTLSFVGAVSFHSWRGWDKETLGKWAGAASKLGIPLMVAEGSIDAAAWNYPAIFEESSYAMEEINLYIRLLAICQPASILQWQLTSDYSILSGGGIFGNNEPLRPTQRFWNLKQLSITPAHLLAMPLTCDRPYISCAALGNNAKRIYAIHLVNGGASRDATLVGLPKKLKSMRIYTTNKDKSMNEGPQIPVSNGEARFTLEADSFTSLVSE